jgi:hypothetical protein
LPPTNPYNRHDVVQDKPATPPPLPASALHEVDTSPEQGPYRVSVTTRLPDPDRGDVGQIAEGSFTIKSGMVYVEDDQGQPLGRQVLKPRDNPKAVAKSILRAKRTPSSFWGPIPYSGSVH